jgi:bifunctional UDP-N-acetylglucosamine pyrophosphorylase/glucosamine-1-phosphate N-acetyltransferase
LHFFLFTFTLEVVLVLLTSLYMEELKTSYYFDDPAAFPFASVLCDLHFMQEYWKKKEDVVSAIKKDIRCPVPEHVVIRGEVFIDEGTMIEPFVLIVGPAYIGKNVLIRSGAWIRPGSIIGDDVVVGHGMELKNVHLASNVKMGTNTFVGDSILGKGARIGSGTIIGNRRFDQQEVQLTIGEKKIGTGKDKFGCILGDYVRLGSNVSTAPGTVIGKHTFVYANASVSGFIPKDSLVKLRQTQEVVAKTGDFQLNHLDQAGER